jgi:hypothetical protein
MSRIRAHNVSGEEIIKTVFIYDNVVLSIDCAKIVTRVEAI